MDAVFLIGVYRLDTVLPAQLKKYRRGLVPGGRGTNQQRNIELLQAVAQGAQVAQPEVDLARRIVMGQPLFGADQVHGQGGAAFGGGAQGGVVDAHAIRLIQDFALALPSLRSLLDTDVLAAYHGDPAARSVDEVLLCYPGILAVIHHRLAHHLYRAGLPLLARISAEIAHSATGIDIHPGAQIGPSFFIDHGTGVVIGETAIIGERVRIYQAVTLGAKRFPADEDGQLQKGHPRHPIVEDDVVIYAGATILGRITIGKGSTIGGNVWLTRSVPAGANITQANLQHDDGAQK